MERTRVADMADRHCGKLSKGYRQRVGLAQALIHNPDVLILDEPTAGLDPKQIIETRELIKQLAGDHTIILSTHILPEVSQTCQRVVIINRGRVVAVDTPGQPDAPAAAGPRRCTCRWTAPARPPRRRSPASPGVTRVAEVGSPWRRRRATRSRASRGATCGATSRGRWSAAGWGLLELRPVRMSLEDIFLQLTTEERRGRRTPPQRGGDGRRHGGADQ